MAIQGIGAGAVTEQKLYTGLCDMEVVGVNPSKDELMTILNTENIKDSMVQYDNTKDGVDGLRLDFWLKSEELALTTKVSFFIEDKLRLSQAGKPQWINDIGQTGWAATADEAVERVAKWPGLLRGTGMRHAHGGEADLYSFLVAWSQIDQRSAESKIVLDTSWAELCSGDVSELDKVIKALRVAGPGGATRALKVRALLTVRNEQYQGVYNRYFLKEGSNYIKQLSKDLDGSTNPPEYGGSFLLKPFSPGQAPEEVTTEASANELDSLMAGM